MRGGAGYAYKNDAREEEEERAEDGEVAGEPQPGVGLAEDADVEEEDGHFGGPHGEADEDVEGEEEGDLRGLGGGGGCYDLGE